MVIRQGDLYWVDTGEPAGSEPGYRRPHVVISNDVVNLSRIQTTLTCAITTNLRLAACLGNVLLAVGEGGLSRESVVNVSQVVTVDKQYLGEHIGHLSRARVREILDGLRLLTEPREL